MGLEPREKACPEVCRGDRRGGAWGFGVTGESQGHKVGGVWGSGTPPCRPHLTRGAWAPPSDGLMQKDAPPSQAGRRTEWARL